VLVALAAVLTAAGKAIPAPEARLAALFALEPRLLTPFLTPQEAIHWRRLIGNEADPLPPNVMQLFPLDAKAWNQAFAQHRATKRLLEDSSSETWAPGEALKDYDTAGWPDGRAAMTMHVAARVTMKDILPKLPQPVLRFVNGEAA
jgi:hypothetical protein